MTHPGITRSVAHSIAQPDGHPKLDFAAAPPAVAVALRGVRKAYGAHPVLAGLDLDVAAGTITLHGRTVDDGHRPLAPEHRRIGYVPQEGGLFPHLSVAANIGFGLPRGKASAARVRELLDLVELDPSYA